MADFELHPRLAEDTIEIGRLLLCRVLMMDDANYPWFILVPQRDGLRELHELPDDELAQFWYESSQVSRWLMRTFDGDKLNLAALGNVVAQLHVHHVVRHEHDPAWPAPIWGRLPVAPMGAAFRAERIQRLQADPPAGLRLAG